MIIGKLLLGKELTLLGSPKEDGTYTITLNENGLTIINDGTTAGIVIKDGNGNKQFYADSEGNLNISGIINAIGGNIGGWILEKNNSCSVLYSIANDSNGNRLSTTGMASRSVSDDDPAFWAGLHDWGNTPWDRPADKPNANWNNYCTFYVTSSGGIKAVKGTVGGWTIDDRSMSCRENDKNYVTLCKPYRWDAATEYTGGLWDVFVVGNDGTWPFVLRSDGSIQAERANITGKSTVGGWIATQSRLYNQSYDSNGNLCSFSLNSPGYSDYAIIECSVGNKTPFWVTKRGELVATGANITGTINASSGSIGKWVIFSEFIQATNSSNETSQLSSSGVWTNQEGDPEGASWHEIVFTCMGGSDEKLKHNIIDFNSSHDKFFDALVPKEFQYNNKQYLGSIQNAHFGFIYQNVLEASQSAHINNLALHWEENGYGKINKMEFIALNTWQIQKLKRRCEALEYRLSKLESNITQ